MMEVIPLDDQSKNMVIALMNAEHPDAIRLYARHFAKHPDAVTAVLVNVQRGDFTIRVHHPTLAHGSQRTEEVTLQYVQADGSITACATIGECRRAMVGMARIAAEALGEEIELPAAAPAPPAGAGGEPPNMEALQQIMQAMQTVQSQGAQADKEQKEQEQKDQEQAAAARPQALNQRGAVAWPTGEGSRLGGSATGGVAAGGAATGGAAAGGAAVVAAESFALREVDPDQPFVRLRVQLLDRRNAQVVVNKSFTVRDVLGWLQHHQGDTRPFNLMDVAGFPPKRLGDLDKTVEQLGLTKDSALSCRPS